MSIHTHSCVTVSCNGCGKYWWETSGEMYVVHYDTVAEALKDIAGSFGWRVADDQHWCPDCAAKQDCEGNGHLMTSWQTCWCRYDADAGEPTCGHLWRQCGHCQGAYERRSFDVIPTL
jgi:hypothetical protein